MKFGHFDDQNKEYVITTPKTPLPWINYLGCTDFFSLMSNTCGGYTFYKDAKLLRMTRYRYNDTTPDTNGKYFYITPVNDQSKGPYFEGTKTCRLVTKYNKWVDDYEDATINAVNAFNKSLPSNAACCCC